MSNDLRSVKQRLTPRLLAIDGVTGIGLREGRLAVYLDGPRDAARQQVQALVGAQAPGTVVEFFESGELRRVN
jgi:hypothetical protein